MQCPNHNGVYAPEHVEEVARTGRAFACVCICQCDDGRYRYAIEIQYSYGGEAGPIFPGTPDFATSNAALDAGMVKLLTRLPAGTREPESARTELRILRKQIEQRLQQPSLF